MRFWEEIQNVISTTLGPLFFDGDLNCILRVEERQGGSRELHADNSDFRDLLNNNDLIDLGCSGSRFTWSRGRSADQMVFKKLDRVTINAGVCRFFRLCSDHSPLLLSFSLRNRSLCNRQPFWFEAMWNRNLSANEGLQDPKDKIMVWKKSVFGRIKDKKNDMMGELATVLCQEETMWLQKSRETWLKDGDRNMSFFHLSLMIRRKYNRATMLLDDDVQWIEDSQALESHVVSFYRNLYVLSDHKLYPIVTPHNLFPLLDDEVWTDLNKEFSDKDIYDAVKGMGALKAPGPDGFQPIFYHRSWGTVGSSVIKEICTFLTTASLPIGLNDMLITLIPKTSNPDKVNLFRPISLCNVYYKIVTKMLINRLQKMLPLLIFFGGNVNSNI
ncbi:hypothetical protein V2J09_018836 [Rumex salicifolius]